MIERTKYIDSLKSKMWNQRIKVITGIRRCGKSTILFELFRQHLLDSGVPKDNIICIDLDSDKNFQFRNPEVLSSYVHNIVEHPKGKFYVLIDEVQFAISKEELKKPDKPVRVYSVLNGLLRLKNVDVYVTGSNSKLLSKDISTEFRGRGDTIRVNPLSFLEFCSSRTSSIEESLDEFLFYGGMPYLSILKTDEDKVEYLEHLFNEIYFKDIEERYDISHPNVLRALADVLCSSIGSLNNITKLVNTVNTVLKQKIDFEVIQSYLSYLEDAFLFSKAARYDVKGKKYFNYPSKFYCSDLGLRNAKLNFRQIEHTHLLENCIYNELLIRGYGIDVGVVQLREKNSKGKVQQKNTEVDFVARKGSKIYYVQVALNVDNAKKEAEELRPLLAIKDSFKKVLISKSYGKTWTDEHGILHLGLFDFLLKENALDL